MLADYLPDGVSILASHSDAPADIQTEPFVSAATPQPGNTTFTVFNVADAFGAFNG